MTAVQNSIDTYIMLVKDDDLSKMQQRVLKYIRDNPYCTYNDISRGLQMHHNSVVPRVKELREAGYIKLDGKKIDEYTHKPNATYRLRNPDEEPDDMLHDSRVKIPADIKDFLRSAVRKENEYPFIEATANNIRWVAQRDGDNVSLDFGDFVKLRNIFVACEDTAQNRFIIAGVNFTVFFKLN